MDFATHNKILNLEERVKTLEQQLAEIKAMLSKRETLKLPKTT